MKELRKAWRSILRAGLIVGFAAVFISLQGIIEAFSKRDIIGGVLSLGHAILILVGAVAGFLVTRHWEPRDYLGASVRGMAAGLLSSGVLALFVLIARVVNLRPVFVNANETLLNLLTFGQSFGLGILLLLIGGIALGATGGIFNALPSHVRAVLQTALAGVLSLSILRDLFVQILGSLGLPDLIIDVIFSSKGLTPIGVILVFALFAGSVIYGPKLRAKSDSHSEKQDQRKQLVLRWVLRGLGIALLLVLPLILGIYWTDVIDLVGLYVLMGLGLNIVVGYAGLLDLGYVAFFAIGAYVTGLLTSPASWLGVGWSFWSAWPIALIAAAFAGVLLGIPVLRMRGDYLAIVTLGFGEIIRILALSDLLKPFIGGAQGILQIPKPTIGGLTLLSSQHLYYLILAGCALAMFVSWRLADSRIGRAWIAIREDEDVAEAMGIDLVKHKLMAFAIGASFSGIGGAIFASKIGSIFPHSFNLIISVNVLCLIIVGGMASIPGVIVGSLIMLGLPEVLREFAEYRMLFYGAALVVMMLVKPEGFWPAERRRLELRAGVGTAEEV